MADLASPPKIPAADVEELTRILTLLAAPGAELVTGGGFEKAIVMDPDRSGDPVATTAARYGAALCAIGWAREIPLPPKAQYRRIKISAGGLEAHARIVRGEATLAAMPPDRPEPAPAALPPREKLRREVMKLPEAERVDYLLDLFEGLTATSEGADLGWSALGVRLGRAELRIMCELAARRGLIVSHAALIWAGSATGGPAEIVALRQMIARIRAKLRAAGAPIRILTHSGRGYAVTAPDGFSIPGEKENAG